MKFIYNILFLCCTTMVFSQSTYVLSKESKLTIEGTSTVHDWTVVANTIQGSLKMEGNTPKEIDFQVDVVDIESERGATMDKKMHAALKKDEHPQVLFTLTEVKDAALLVGDLKIAGNTQNVTINSKMTNVDSTIQVMGEYKIALKDFGIEPPTAMFGQVIVGGDVVVKFDLKFKSKE